MKSANYSLILASILISLTACQNSSLPADSDLADKLKLRDAVVYGADSRKDDFEVSSASHRELAEKTFAVMSKQNLHQISEFYYLIQGRALQETDQLCEGQKFSSQISSASCTATLVGPDLMLTAGHCFPRETSCEQMVFTNQFRLQASDDSGQNFIASKDIYHCKEVEYLSLETSSQNYDFAFIRLDRAVSEVEPIDLEKARDPITFETVHNFSFPAGLPRKHLDGSVNNSGVDELHFYAEIDTFVGSSGSMVYSMTDNSPLGILVGGAPDYVENVEGQCQKIKVCESGECKGERILKLTEINKLMKHFRAELSNEI